jgi:ERCC4-related helicase
MKFVRDKEAKRRLVESTSSEQLIRLAEWVKSARNPKLARLSRILQDFYASNPESLVMIFTQLPGSASEVSEHIDKLKCVKNCIFC